MGKTGAGKSTLINAVIEKNVAPTGMGQAITRQNKIYTQRKNVPIGYANGNFYGVIKCQLSMYDTVGLEVDSAITDNTLAETSKHIANIRKQPGSDNITLVWFCINENAKRFESYEIELIRKLSIEYEVPFMIVLTQSLSQKEGALEKQIRSTMPDVLLRKVMAEKYSLANGITIPSSGVKELLKTTLTDYSRCKIRVLENKLIQLDEDRKKRIEKIKSNGNHCIKKHVSSASKIGLIPVGCVPFVYGICIDMISELNSLAGLKGEKGLATELFPSIIAGLVFTPLMAVPLLSSLTAQAYIESVGEEYLKVLLTIINRSTDKELKNNALMKKRIEEELSHMKK